MLALARGAASLAAGRHPLAVLDVDLTLVENGPRTRRLLADFVRAREDLTVSEREAAVGRAEGMPLAFSIQKNVLALGLDPALTADALAFWRRAFFDPARLADDVALPGAVDAVAALRAADVSIVYLTARPRALAAGTVAALATMGFPVAEAGAVLVTKDDPREADHAYKARALRWIGRLGEVVLCADNEPVHANEMHAAFPDALTVLVATRHSEPAPPLAPAIVRVPDLGAAL